MSNIATTISQSRKLIELGLDPNSADMVWTTANPDLPMLLAYPIEDCNSWNDKVPAWSLSALLEVMPKEIKKDDKQYNFHLETTHNLYYVSYYRYDIDGIRYLHTTEMNNCTIDAAYEMVCWLLEQGFIKKGGQDGRD